MSWSTSSRERAKLGRLDSEPPLLLREWPPETGRRDKGGIGMRRIQANRGQREGGEEGNGAGVTTSKQRLRRGREVETERKRERERKRGQSLPIYFYWF